MDPFDHTADLVAFREAAVAKGDFAARPNQDRMLFERMREVWRRCSTSESGLAALRTLLEDPSDHVRCWVAVGLICRGEDRARAVLDTLAEESSLVGFNARMVLEQFDKGQLKPPFEP